MAQNETKGSGRTGDAQRNEDRPNQNANKEPAEGSRENVRSGQQGGRLGESTQGQQFGEAGGGDSAQNRKYNQNQQGAGITNRPLEREETEQTKVPPRGQTKDEEQGNA